MEKGKSKIKTTTTKTITEKKLYNPIPKKIKMEIRTRFEVGENLLDLAIEYKVNFYTLKNCASKEKWEKGKIIEIVYQELEEVVTEDIKKDKLLHQRDCTYLHKKLTNDMLKDAIADNCSKKSEEIYSLRAGTIERVFKLGNQILGIETTREKLDISISRIRKKLLEKEWTKASQNGDIELLD